LKVFSKKQNILTFSSFKERLDLLLGVKQKVAREKFKPEATSVG